MKKLLSVLLVLSLLMSFAHDARADQTGETVTVPIAVEVNGETVITVTPEAGSPAYPTPTLTVENQTTLEFSFSAPGDYAYTVKQAGTDPTVYYDATEYEILFHLETNWLGDLEGTVSLHKKGSDFKEEKIVFENADVAPITDDPPVEKQVTGSPDSPATFSFTLEAVTSDAPMPAGSSGGKKTVSVTGPGEVEFGLISFTKVGTYEYTVKEVTGTEEGYAYDSAVYTLRYEITEQDGVLSMTRTILKDGVDTGAMKAVFENEYTKTEEETITIIRTIIYKEYDEDGREIFVRVEQPIKLKRKKITGPGGDVSYGPWEIDEGEAPPVDSPEYPGWTPDQETVPEWEIDLTDPKDETVIVVYTPEPEEETITITRTITYTEYTPEGREVHVTVVQTVTLIRTRTTGRDGSVTYGPWEILEGETGSVITPPYEGWTPDLDLVPEWDIDLTDPKSEVIHVVFKPETTEPTQPTETTETTEPTQPTVPTEPTQPTVPPTTPRPTAPTTAPEPPDTGDRSDMTLWILLGAGSLLTAGVLFVATRKKRDEEGK